MYITFSSAPGCPDIGPPPDTDLLIMCITILFCTVMYCAVLYSSVQYYTVLCITDLFIMCSAWLRWSATPGSGTTAGGSEDFQPEYQDTTSS